MVEPATEEQALARIHRRLETVHVRAMQSRWPARRCSWPGAIGASDKLHIPIEGHIGVPFRAEKKNEVGGATVTTLLCPYGGRGKIKQPEALARPYAPLAGDSSPNNPKTRIN